ncbi:MAG: hypothetical protein WAN71_12680 [Mycobacterium sp.]
MLTQLISEGVADRILALPDGSIPAPTREQVEAMVAGLPRRY